MHISYVPGNIVGTFLIYPCNNSIRGLLVLSSHYGKGSVSDLCKVMQAVIGMATFWLQSEYPYPPLGCFKVDTDKVLVSRMTLKVGMAKPDKAMRNHQNLIEYHFNIFMTYKVLSDMKHMKKCRILSYSKILELDERIFKILRAKEIQNSNR